jgi:cytochrome c oxidase accessory protein FixG
VAADFTLPQLDDRVLSTLNLDGTRRWMQPRDARGRFWRARLSVAVALVALFTALPWIRISGKPAVLLDVMTRQFTFFGTTFRSTETLLLAILMITVFVAIFLITALFGRVWCGWGCPQTVYLEFVYRPLERLFLGTRSTRGGGGAPLWRRIAMYVAFLVISAHLANTFLAYFVGTDRMLHWTTGNPANHPVAFAVFAVTVALMLFDFVFFREQLCTLVCPYGRMQSVLLDRSSLIVAYDGKRGEPRARSAQRKKMEETAQPAGDCIECTMCTQVCPTGIDIRNGLQLECIHCAQCIDACDEVMKRIDKPPGLIRYSSQDRMEGTDHSSFRYRLILYPALLIVLVSIFLLLLSRREQVLIEQERTVGSNFTLVADGSVETPIRLLIENRTDFVRTFTVHGTSDVSISGEVPLVQVAPASAVSVSFLVRTTAASFGRGSRHGSVLIRDDRGDEQVELLSIAGPFNATGPISSGGNP